MVIYTKTLRPLGGKPLTRMTPRLVWTLIKLFSVLHGALTEEEEEDFTVHHQVGRLSLPLLGVGRRRW